MLKNVLLTAFVLLSLIPAGCSDNNHSSDSITVFSEFVAPTTAAEVEVWLADMPVSAETIRSKIVSTESPDWEDDLIPLYDFMQDLSDDNAYSTILMRRSQDPNVRALGYTAYQTIPQIQDSLVADNDLKMAVETALSRLVPITPKQQAAADYLTSIFESSYTIDQQIAISEANQNLTTISLAFYNNAVSKSASATFSPDEFNCLSDEIKSQIPTDIAGNYTFDANSSLYYTLMRSCLDESVRERLHAAYASKAAEDNALLWPEILERRLIYANAYGYDDFSSMRLSEGMIQTADDARTLLYQVKTISDSAFERLKDRYKSVQSINDGSTPEIVSMWSKDRYSRVVNSELLGSAPANPKLLTYPATFDKMLYLLGKIVGLRFVKTEGLETKWNNDVVEYQTYDMETNSPTGTLLVDPYSIDGLDSPAAAQYVKRSRILKTGERQTPVVVLNSSLAKSNTASTYMSSYDYYVFGHELGHAIHMLLQTKYSSQKKDFNEVPSTFFGELVKHPEFLKAVLSSDPATPLEELPGEFVSYWQYYRESPVNICENLRWQLVNSGIILDLTTWTTGSATDLGEVAKTNLQDYYYPYSSQSQPFYNSSYVVNPATDSNYHLYVLGDVISRELLSAFESSIDGIFDQEIGNRYRYHILENSSPDSEAAITNFLGREWNYDAFRDWFEEITEDL